MIGRTQLSLMIRGNDDEEYPRDRDEEEYSRDRGQSLDQILGGGDDSVRRYLKNIGRQRLLEPHEVEALSLCPPAWMKLGTSSLGAAAHGAEVASSLLAVVSSAFLRSSICCAVGARLSWAVSRGERRPPSE